jgi:hypothetical protein
MFSFKSIDSQKRAELDLEEAKQKLLAYEHQANYNLKMVDFYRETIKRLQGYTENGVS